MIELTLPFPPSVNHYWRRTERRGRSALTDAAVKFHKNAETEIFVQRVRPSETISGPVLVEMWLYPPDRRVRDIDNHKKGVYDALEKNGIILSDSLIRKEIADWMEVREGGLCRLRIWC